MRFMLYEFLKNNYKEAEPIFFSDIVIEGITKSAVNQQLKKLCDEGKLQKYENGIYYLPKKSRLKTNVGVNADMVARYKYVSRGGKVDGFYSGNTFANQLGISTQVPNKVEIVSNNMAAKIREIPIGKRTFIVRKPVVPVNEENVYVLQLLDLLKNLDVRVQYVRMICTLLVIFFVSKISKDMKYVTQNLVKNPMLIAIFALGIVVLSYFVSVIGYSRKK